MRNWSLRELQDEEHNYNDYRYGNAKTSLDQVAENQNTLWTELHKLGQQLTQLQTAHATEAPAPAVVVPALVPALAPRLRLGVLSLLFKHRRDRLLVNQPILQA